MPLINLHNYYINFGALIRSNMAEQRQGDIQRLVRSIVADLMSQEQNTPVEAATSNTSGNRYESIDQELNNSFRIPRGTSRENISGTVPRPVSGQ